MKRVLGLDVGDRRIGVAISDELGITARGLCALERSNLKADTQRILDIVRENDCSCIVIGLPLNLSGADSLQTEKVREFAVKLENKLVSNAMQEVRVELFDERFTTVIADRAMKDSGASQEKRREVIDMQAAAVILGDWLSGGGQGPEEAGGIGS